MNRGATEEQAVAVERLAGLLADPQPGLTSWHEACQRQWEAIVPRWRPIETAPHNEDRLLGVVDGNVRFIYWGKTSHVPLYGWNLADQGAEDCELCEPTHWMRIPEPPE